MTPRCSPGPGLVALHMKPLLDTEMIDFMCRENNKEHLVRSVRIATVSLEASRLDLRRDLQVGIGIAP
jgi:hypothetical protein